MKYIVIFEKDGETTNVSISTDRIKKLHICSIYDNTIIINEEVATPNPEKIALNYAEFFCNNFIREEK